MPTSPIAGFISKKEAAEIYERSHRQLTRDVRDALLTRDAKVLPHIRLRTDDDHVREGSEITIELIKQLRLEGANPVWYFRSSWLDKTFGRRSEPNPDAQTSDEPMSAEEGIHTGDIADKDRMLFIYEELVHELREELKIKNQQIRDASDRQKETNTLTQELHHLLHAMLEPGGQRFLIGANSAGAAPVNDARVSTVPSKPATSEVVGEGTLARTTTVSSRKKIKTAKTKAASRVQTTTRLEHLLPTFAALFRRK